MFVDDDFYERLVLKGGNALSLVHGIGGRTSLDLDFSVAGDLEDEVAPLDELERRMIRALKNRLEPLGYTVFDASLIRKPKRLPTDTPQKIWGGYLLRFKVISEENSRKAQRKTAKAQSEIDMHRRMATTVSANQHRIFKVEISKYEYCAPKVSAMLDGFQIQAYPLALIAIEKARALCQQLPVYTQTAHPRPRARDFYDIHSVITKERMNLCSPENQRILQACFDAKQVPVGLIPHVWEAREFHRPDWDNVVASVGRELEAFDTYFDFFVEATRCLQPLWDE